MIETQLNLFDAAVIGIMVLSCLFAFFRGFVKEILSLGAWIGAGIVTIYFMEDVGKLLAPHFKKPDVAHGFGAVGLYVVALIGFSIFNMLIQKFLKAGSDVGMLDNTLGLAFGIFRGGFIISLGFFLLTIAMPEKEYPKWIKEAATRPYVEKGAMILAKTSPEHLREMSTLSKKLEDRMISSHESLYENNDNEAAPAKETGYSKSSSRQLDRLIDSNREEQ